jgi:hypothetical protein
MWMVVRSAGRSPWRRRGLLSSRERVSRERELDVTLPPIYVGNVTFNLADGAPGVR